MSILFLIVHFKMTLHYQTLREYTYILYLEAEFIEMDVVVELVGIQFPPDNVCKILFYYYKLSSSSYNLLKEFC